MGMWETIEFKKSWKPMPRQELLVWHLRRNLSTKWSGVFQWFVDNRHILTANKSQHGALLKKPMLAISENIAVTSRNQHGDSPMMLAALFDDTDSILALIKRNVDVNQQNDYGCTVLHFAARYGNINACKTLLDNKAKIDARCPNKTPLMWAAFM